MSSTWESPPGVLYRSTVPSSRCAVAITASHNPPEYNGFKVARKMPLGGEDLQEVRRSFEAGELNRGWFLPYG